MIYIIGVHHEVQYWDGSNNPFLKSLCNWGSRLKLSVIAEELNQEAITNEEKFQKKPLESVAHRAASLLNLEHRFGEPNTSERADLKIPTTHELRKSLGLRVGQDEDRVEKEKIRRCWPLRENVWLDRIKDKSQEGILFICGVSHVERFLSLVETNGHRAVVLHKDWGIETELDDIVSE